MRLLVLHGPNLDSLGAREPDVYGEVTLEVIDDLIRSEAATLGVEVDIRQTAREGELIEWLHEGSGKVDGAVINPGAYTHTSRALADAMRAVDYPIVEVHLSNIHAREEWRRVSVTAEAALGSISGFGPSSYLAAIRLLKDMGGRPGPDAGTNLDKGG